MSDAMVENNFHLRLSSYLTRSFSEAIEKSGALEDLSDVIQQYYGPADTGRSGSVTSPGGLRPSPPAAAPSMLESCLTKQNAANERLRQVALLPLRQQIKSCEEDDNKEKRPTIAILARYQRLKRLLDILSDTMKIEQEILKVWTSEETVEQLKTYTRNRAMEIINEETNTLFEQSQKYSTSKLEVAGSSSSRSQSSSTAVSPKHRLEETIYFCHESIERILRALAELGSTLQVSGKSGGVEDNMIMMEFDAIGKRRMSSSSSVPSSNPVSPVNRSLPTLVNYTTAIDTLSAALPFKYNIEVLQQIASLPSDDN